MIEFSVTYRKVDYIKAQWLWNVLYCSLDKRSKEFMKKNELGYDEIKKRMKELNDANNTLEYKFIKICNELNVNTHTKLYRNLPLLNKWYGDFVDKKTGLIFQTDGPQHDNGLSKTKDKIKDMILSYAGYKVIRLNYKNIKYWDKIIKTALVFNYNNNHILFNKKFISKYNKLK